MNAPCTCRAYCGDTPEHEGGSCKVMGWRAPRADDVIWPWDSDHTALVHVLWEAKRKGLTLDSPDDLASLIMRSKWMRAVRLHAGSDER